MKILHVIYSFTAGGAELMLVDLLRAQSSFGKTHLIIINNVLNNDLLTLVNAATEIHCLNRNPGSRNIVSLFKLNLLIREINPDIIHAHNESVIALIFKGLRLHWRIFVTVHDVNKSCTHLKKYSKIFSISNAVQHDLLKRCGLRSVVVMNGIDFKNIQRKTHLSLSKSSLKIVQVSRLCHEKKGQDLLIDALVELRNNYGIDASVTFIGEGDSLEILKEHARKLNVYNHCIFTGLWAREKIYRDLCKFDVLVQPSIWEGFGLTVVEGIGAEIPVVVSDGGGPAEIINNGTYGWLFRNGDSKHLATVLACLVKPELQNEIDNKIKKAYSHVLEKYDISRTANHYLDEYFQI